MANPLTGDFEAVLQVSEGTLNRLLASMHQNGFENPANPSFPHSATLRIGDGFSYDNVRGTVRVQVGVPRLKLFHGAIDRFQLEVGIRARYKSDAGSKPLPEFIHGTVRAEYRIHDIDPSCPGWSKKAADFIWVRVIRDTVQFTGTAVDDAQTWLASAIGSGQDIESRLGRLIARELATTFAAAPHPVSRQFRRGAMRSLSVPGSGAAVALPIGLSGDPMGAITSINNALVGGSDFVIAIQRDSLLALAEPALSAIGNYTTTVKVHIDTGKYNPIPDIDTVYRVSVSPPVVEWHPFGHYAVITVRASGSARTNSVLADATFDVAEDIVISFDGGAERLSLSAGSPYVSVHASGLGNGTVAGAVKNAVVSSVKAIANAACVQAQPHLDTMIARKQELITQLRTIDDQCDAHVEQAEFVADGMVLRGVISVAARKPALLKFDETVEADGYSAFLSWIPAGRIDQLVWSWTWFDAGQPGQATQSDRYLLRRPPATHSHWGAMAAIGGTTPLPGLDGSGRVCLTIKGVRVDRYTGDLVSFVSRKECRSFGYPLYLALDDGMRLFLKTRPHEPALVHDVPFPELGLMNVNRRASTATPGAPNTLLVYADGAWDLEAASSLAEGMERSRRRDAALQVLVLFRDGVLTPALAAKVEGLASSIGAKVIANEDVQGGWSRAFDLPSGNRDLAWRLISPAGGVTWMHNGRLPAQTLTQALDHGLIPCSAVRSPPMSSSLKAGLLVEANSFRHDLIEAMDAEPTCPPLALNKLGIRTVVAFAQAGSSSSAVHVQALARTMADARDEQQLVVVLDGADSRTARALQEALGRDHTVLPDVSGSIARRFGVRIWPTTLDVNRRGVVSSVRIGHEPDDARVEAIE